MAKLAGDGHVSQPLHPFFISLGGPLLISALFTDYMYSINSLMQWANFSAWLITGGLVMALIAVIALLIDFVLGKAARIRLFDFGLVALAALISLGNIFVHTRDAWTSVVPTGITLSAVVTVLLLIAGVRGWRVTAIRTAGVGVVA